VYIAAAEYDPIPLGCYIDEANPRTLDGSYREDSKMTPTSCINSCRANNFKYAGLQYGRQVSHLTLDRVDIQCYCGNSLYQNKKTSSGCTVPCGGDARSTCGGNYRLNIYQLSGVPVAEPETTTAPSTTSARPSTTSAKPSTTAVPSSSSAPAPSASVYGVKAPPSSSNAKYVWAHHMVGNVSQHYIGLELIGRHTRTPEPSGLMTLRKPLPMESTDSP
jgi:glucan endo-1,3-alpha-glucosidase